MKNMNGCKGFLGWAFGHRFKPVYDTDRESYSADEIVRIMKQEFHSGASTARLIHGHENPITKDKRVTQVLRCFCCSRCGNIIKDSIE